MSSGGGLGAASFAFCIEFIALMATKTAAAMIKKSMAVLMNVP